MRNFSAKEAKSIGDKIGVNWDKIPLEQFRMGLAVELEHGKEDPQTNITDDDLVATGKIALRHLKESDRYYTDLEAMEKKEKARQESLEAAIDELVEALFLDDKPEDPSSLYSRMAQILTVGLHQDLPDDINDAVAFLSKHMKIMALRKRPLLLKALRQMGRRARAMSLLKTMKTEY